MRLVRAIDRRGVVLARIEKIELRSLTSLDILDQDGIGTIGPDGKIIPDQLDIQARLALSSYSIHGNILAGAGFGIGAAITGFFSVFLSSIGA